MASRGQSAFPALTSAGGVGALVGVLTVALRRPSAPSVTPAAVRLVLLSGAVAGLGLSRTLWLSVLLIAAAGALQFGVMTHCWHFVGPTLALGTSGCVSLAFATYLLVRHRPL